MIRKTLERYPKPIPPVLALVSIVAAYSLFFIGFFSRTPFSHITIMGAWSTSGIIIEVNTKIILAILMGRFVFYMGYGASRNTNSVRYLANLFLRDHGKSRALQIFVVRFLRRNSNLGPYFLALVLFSIFALENFYGIFGIIFALLAVQVVSGLLYSLFFRPGSMSFSRYFILLPKRPVGVSNDRWVIYLLSCLSIVAAGFFYFTGLAVFHARAVTFQSLHMENGVFVGSTIAANGSGVLFLKRNIDAENWQYSRREYVFYPFNVVQKISNKLPD